MEYVFRKQRRATMNFSTIGNLNTQLKTMEMKNLWNLKQENKDYTSKGKTLDEWLKSAEVEAIQEMVDRGDEKLRNICTKMEFGGNLTPEEREYLKAKAPDKYQELVAEEAEQKAYEEALRRCKTQEEVDRLQMGRIHKAVSTLKSVENNPNIPLHKKLEIAMKENRTLQDAMESTAKFIESGAYDRLPSEKDEVKDKEQTEQTEQTETKEPVLPEEENKMETENEQTQPATQDTAGPSDAKTENTKVEPETVAANTIYMQKENPLSYVTKDMYFQATYNMQPEQYADMMQQTTRLNRKA